MKHERRYVMILLCIAAAALLVCAVVPALKRTAVPAQGKPEQTYKEDYSSKSAASQEIRERAAQSAAVSESYRVMEYQGKIGIFRDGQGQPVRTAEVDVTQLPEEDQRLLRQGIPAETLAEARRILEDYQ